MLLELREVERIILQVLRQLGELWLEKAHLVFFIQEELSLVFQVALQGAQSLLVLWRSLVKILLSNFHLAIEVVHLRVKLLDLSLEFSDLGLLLNLLEFALLEILLHGHRSTLGGMEQLLWILALGSQQQAFSLSFLQFGNVAAQFQSAFLDLGIVLAFLIGQIFGNWRQREVVLIQLLSEISHHLFIVFLFSGSIFEQGFELGDLSMIFGYSFIKFTYLLNLLITLLLEGKSHSFGIW